MTSADRHGEAAGRPRVRDCCRGDDRGSAVVEFVLVSTLLVLLVGAVIQLAMVLHVRNTLVDCAGEGARYAALQGNGPAAGIERTRTLISSALSPGYAQSVSARTTTVGGTAMMEVQVVAPLPLAGLLGPDGVVRVSGHAVLEG